MFVEDIRETGRGFSVSLACAERHSINIEFDVSASSAQATDLLKRRPNTSDQLAVVVKLDSLVRRQVRVETEVDDTNDPDSASVNLVGLPFAYLAKGNLIDFELVPYDTQNGPLGRGK